MDESEKQKLIAEITNRQIISRGNIQYDLVVWKADSRNPIIISARDTLSPPSIGENFETNGPNGHLGGVVESKSTVVNEHQDFVFVTTFLGLKD